MARPAIAVVLLFLAVGCKASPQPDRTLESSNAGYQLGQLFTDEGGRTVYRFYDKGDWRYYVVDADGQSQMLPTTRTVREPATTFDAGIGIGRGRRR